MTKLFEAMADIKLTTENIQKVIKMFPRDNDWKKLITKNRRDIDALRRGKDLPKKVEDELFNWALDNGEIKTDDVEELEDFIDSIMNEGTFEIAESVPKAVQGLNDLGNKMKGRDQKDIRRIEKLYRSGNNKVFQGAIRALDTDLRDQVKDIFDALDMVKNGVIESVDLDEAKKLGSRVKITKGRFAGKEGIIRQMDNGRFKGDAKSFDIDLDNGKEANGVPGKDIKIVKESVEEAKAPKMKGVSIKGSEVTGLRAKDGKLYSAKPLISSGKLSYRVEDEFGAFDTIDLKTFAKRFG